MERGAVVQDGVGAMVVEREKNRNRNSQNEVCLGFFFTGVIDVVKRLFCCSSFFLIHEELFLLTNIARYCQPCEPIHTTRGHVETS